jgi:DNA invertase Pin-like site-specific DNA recombinase
MKCAVLVRESKLEAGSSGNAVESQRDFLLDWCQQQGHAVVDVYVDDGVSGILDFSDRAEGARLLRDAERGAFQAVVLSRVDRAGRKVEVIHAFLRRLSELGVDPIFVTQPIDHKTPSGRAHLGMLAVFAAMEREILLERMHTGRVHVAKSGGWAGGPTPLGYTVDNGGNFPALRVDREPADGLFFSESALVARIFNDFLKRHSSVQSLVDTLNDEAVPTPSAINWPDTSRRAPPATGGAGRRCGTSSPIRCTRGSRDGVSAARRGSNRSPLSPWRCRTSLSSPPRCGTPCSAS